MTIVWEEDMMEKENTEFSQERILYFGVQNLGMVVVIHTKMHQTRNLF